MALTTNVTVARRGPVVGDQFGYLVSPGEVIYAGGLFGVNAAGQAVRIQTAGIESFAGIALGGYSNVGSSAASPYPIVGATGDTWQLTVPGATPANINAKVYATDDSTLTLTAPTSGFEAMVGYLVGIENGLTYVKIQGH